MQSAFDLEHSRLRLRTPISRGATTVDVAGSVPGGGNPYPISARASTPMRPLSPAATTCPDVAAADVPRSQRTPDRVRWTAPGVRRRFAMIPVSLDEYSRSGPQTAMKFGGSGLREIGLVPADSWSMADRSWCIAEDLGEWAFADQHAN